MDTADFCYLFLIFWIHMNEFIFICGSEYKTMVNITEHSSEPNWLNICEYFQKVIFNYLFWMKMQYSQRDFFS